MRAFLTNETPAEAAALSPGPQTMQHSLTYGERQCRRGLAAPPGLLSEAVLIPAPCQLAPHLCEAVGKSNFFFEHNVGGLIDLTKHPATKEITENWKINDNLV